MAIEELFYDLEAPAVNHVLRKVSRLASPGSVLVTDLVGQSLLTSAWMAQALKAMEAQGMGWRLGTDDPTRLFAPWLGYPKQTAWRRRRQIRCLSFLCKGRSSWSFFVVAQRT